jgi:hypothetical protein
LLSEIYLVIVLVIALLGGGINKYKQIQICIKDSIPTSINFTSDQISFFGHVGLPYVKSLKDPHQTVVCRDVYGCNGAFGK